MTHAPSALTAAPGRPGSSREPNGSGLELSTATNDARRARITRAGAAGGAQEPLQNPLEPLQKTPTAILELARRFLPRLLSQ